METRSSLLGQLDETIAQFLEQFRTLAEPETAAAGGWSAKEILAHLTFWHERFARNVGDLAAGRKPAPLKGTLAALNQRSVEAMRDCTRGEGGAKPGSAADLLQ